MPTSPEAIAAIWKIESPKVIAGVTRIVRDVSLAEDMAQDALVQALEQWPAAGLPDNPGAWLMTAAKRRALDARRHRKMADRKLDDLGREAGARMRATDYDLPGDDDRIEDDLLRLTFMTCHPVLA